MHFVSNMKHRWFFSFCFAAAFCTAEDNACGKAPKSIRAYLKHIEPGGIGYSEGYSTLEVFIMPFEHKEDVFTPFLDLRGHVFNDCKCASNVGIGMRCLSSWVWGFSAYWDYRKTSRHAYNQVTLGAEALGEYVDFRANGYISVGDARSHLYAATPLGFEDGHQMFLHKREFSLQGANGEIGVHLDWFETMPLYVAAGPYFLAGGKRETWGGQLRAAVDVYEYVRIEGNTSYDRLFEWIGQGQISVVIPFGPKRRVLASEERGCATQTALEKRMVQRIDRAEIIPVHRKHKKMRARTRA